MAKKYAHINFTPPQSVRNAAKRGLELRRKYGRGGLSAKEASKQGIGSGVQRATNLANGNKISPETIGRMVSFFARHEKNKDSKTDSGEPGAGAIAWLLWGGSPGKQWAEKVKRQMESADMKKDKSLVTLASQIMTVRNGAKGGIITTNGNPLLPLDGCIVPSRYHLPLTYKADVHKGAMVALFLPTSTGVKFVLNDPDAIPLNELHVTLAYLGEADLLSHYQVEHTHEILELISGNYPPLQGNINGCGRFCNDEDKDPFFIIPDLPKLPVLRQLVVDFLDSRCEIKPTNNHGFTPHITLTYIPHSSPNPFDSVELTPVTFPTISLVLGGKRYDYPLTMGVSNISKAAFIERIGARHTRGENELIQKMHDVSLQLGAECHPLERKAGAKHSYADQRMIQRIHDDCTGLGAACKALPQKDEVYHSQVMKEVEIIKAQSDAPNYKPASTPQRCENCKFFLGEPGRDWCELYDFTADTDYTCDSWQTSKPDEISGYEANKADLATLVEGILVLRGGKTSGNWGHAGRPKKRGGSSAGGGFGKIGVKSGASRKQVKQAAEKKRGSSKAKPESQGNKGKASSKKVESKSKNPTGQSKKPANKPTSKPKSVPKNKPETENQTKTKDNLSEIDEIMNKAPKSSEKLFRNYLADQVAAGKISWEDAGMLVGEFSASSKEETKVGNVNTARKTNHRKMTREYDSWHKGLSEVESDALLTYTSGEYYGINSGLRGTRKLSAKNKKVISDIDKALSKTSLKEDTIVYRGMNEGVLKNMFGSDMKKWVGREYSDKGYTSTSVNPKGSFRGIQMEIRVPKGAKAGYLGNHPNNVFGKSEQELLLGRNQNIRILKVRGGKKPKVIAEIVQ